MANSFTIGAASSVGVGVSIGSFSGVEPRTKGRTLTVCTRLLVTSGTDSTTPSNTRHAEKNRLRLIIRNPVGSPGSIRVGSSAELNNFTNVATIAGTGIVLTAGQEMVTHDHRRWYHRSNSTIALVPANLYIEIEVETFV